ncbi:MAG TPA: hypothetical protein VMU93_04335 [Caulobacteraceae bacterium]|nr:hypothetical protein [Caulobacteraceae bacterium]
MSAVRYAYPKLRLAEQLKAPGGRPVVEALQAAQKNLDEIRPQCLDELRALTAEALACFAGFTQAFSAQRLEALYAIAAGGVGLGKLCGTPEADTTLVSLCGLLDHLCASGRWDREAVAVHVQTLQLLALGAGRRLDPAAADQILSGLKKVSARYAHLAGLHAPGTGEPG